MKQYVIIGNSIAAVGAIESIRRVDTEGAITVVSQEPHAVYGRPLISYWLWGKTDRERMNYRPADFYEKNGVTLLLGKTAAAIDPKAQTVSLESGEVLPYDELLVATGSRPFVPPMQGLDTGDKVFSFMTLDDAAALGEAITSESRVLIVGAGLIGLKCAEGIHERVKEITVVDMADRILPSVLDEASSKRVQTYLEQKGLRFMLSDSAATFDKHQVTLKSGKTIDFDILVLAVGVRPNTELVAQAGGEVARGIVADTSGRTSLPHVYAAGDCCESYDITAGQRRVLALLPNAYRQGEAAGYAMAGEEKPFDTAMPLNAVGFMGLHIVTAGSYNGEKSVIENEEDYRCFFVQDGVLNGMILIGDVRRAGIYTSLIRNRTPLDTVDFEAMKRHPQLMAFPLAQRKAALASRH